MITMAKLVAYVHAMRFTQNLYFRTKQKDILNTARALERIVDRELAVYITEHGLDMIDLDGLELDPTGTVSVEYDKSKDTKVRITWKD